MTSFVSPSFLKQQAKKQKKIKAITMSKALDLVAQNYGYSNYRHYLNASLQTSTLPQKDELLEWKNKVREQLEKDSEKAYGMLLWVLKNEENMMKRTISAFLLYEEYETSFKELLGFMSYLDDSGVQTVCEEIGLNDDVQSELLDFYLNDGSVQVDSFATHPRVEDVYLGTAEYTLTAYGLNVSGNFDVSVELQYGSDSDNENGSNHSHSFGGDFSLEIDSEKFLSLQNAEIEEGSFYE